MTEKPDATAVRLACLRIAARGQKDVHQILAATMLLVGFVEGANEVQIKALVGALR